jgi:hypothetical protein
MSSNQMHRRICPIPIGSGPAAVSISQLVKTTMAREPDRLRFIFNLHSLTQASNNATNRRTPFPND